MSNFFKLIIAIGVSEAAGIVGSLFTVSAIKNPLTGSGQAWYAALTKPMFNPPSWIFGPVWIILYALMGIAAFLIWRVGLERKEVKIALGVFSIQLFLNVIWSVIFFGLQSLGWALVVIALLLPAIIWTMLVFYKISKSAAYLLVPYVLWVSFAAYLNYAIFILN